MTSREAREILKTYRPGVDWPDAAYHEAVAQAKSDPELTAWLEEQGIVYEAIRSRLREVPIPADLAGKILANHRRRRGVPPILQLAAALVALLAVVVFWFDSRPEPAVFTDYRASMTKLVAKKYPMSLESPDFARVRKFLANNQSPADYAVPDALKKTTLLGCATLTWGANPVSLLCFRQADGGGLWLFVTGQSSMAGSPTTTAPVIAQSNGLITASWQRDGKVYVLASRGDSDSLRRYLEE